MWWSASIASAVSKFPTIQGHQLRRPRSRPSVWAVRKKALAALLAFALALAGNSVRTAAAILPGGSSQDVALREAALLQNIEDVKDALKKGANANAPSATPLRTTPLSALAVGLGWH